MSLGTAVSLCPEQRGIERLLGKGDGGGRSSVQDFCHQMPLAEVSWSPGTQAACSAGSWVRFLVFPHKLDLPNCPACPQTGHTRVGGRGD